MTAVSAAAAAWAEGLSFTVAPVLSAGSLPTSLASGDFNGDGKPDLAVTNSAGVSILLSAGNGGFQPLVSYVAGTGPQSVAIGDFNGDGKADLAVANQGSNTVSVLLGNGNGTFQAGVAYPAGASPRWVAIGDFNGDGKPDLAVADYGNLIGVGGGVSVLLGNANGTFQVATFLAGAGSQVGSQSVAVGDFNGDSKADLALANAQGSNVSVLLGNGNGTFQPVVNYSTNDRGLSGEPTSVVVGDFNQDGKPDLAVASSHLNDVAVLLGVGNGVFQAPVHYGLDSYGSSGAQNVLATGDLNGDGKPDLVVANHTSNHVTVLLGSGTGAFPTSKSYAAGTAPTGVTLADFNGDGIPDIAVANNAAIGKVALLLGNADGTVQSAPLYRSAYRPESIVAGDLNGDGKLDLVEASSRNAASGTGSVVVTLGNGNGTFQAPAILGIAGVTSVALGDINGDGKLDLVETNPSPGNGNVAVLLGNGNGSFESPVSYVAGSGPKAVAVADFNGDGKADLVVANLNSANVSVLLNLGNGTFQAAVNYATPNSGSPNWVAVADFNGDGKPDLAVSIGNGNSVAVLLGNGNGTFQASVSFPVGFSPLSVVAADFNRDGKLDFAASNGASVAVLLGNGNGSFQTAVTYPVGGSPGFVAVSDFNGDGKADLVATSSAGVSVLIGNGDGTFQTAVSYMPFAGGPLAAGDFDGDGRPDLAVAGSSQDTIDTDTMAILTNISVIPVSLTIATAPAGLAAALDGAAPCSTPCNFTLNWATVHTISVASPQASSPGTRFVLDSWSDGGAILHQIRTPGIPTTYTASFKTQHQLTISASPAGGGAVTPVTGNFYDSATVAPITATANSGFTFAGWTGNVANASSPSTTVTLSSPQTVTANFSQTASCSFSINPASAPAGSGSGLTGQLITGSFTLTASNCLLSDTWTAASDSPRLLVTGPPSGNGAVVSTTINYSMYTNSTTQPRVAHISVAGKTFTLTQSGSTETQAQRVVRALYQTILGREPDSGGWTFWTGPGAPRDGITGATLFNQMADGFYTSPEFKNSGWLTLDIYQVVTGALPTFATWLSAVTQIRSQALTARQLTDNLARQVGNLAFVQTAYQNGFGRAPDATELSAGVTTLNGGQSKLDYLNAVILASAEFTSGTNGTLVQALYYTILVRDTDTGGFNFWLGQINPPNGQNGIYYLYNPQPVTPAYTFKLAVIGQAVPPNPQLLGFLGSPEFQGLIQ